jgi:hypothetical protein
MRTLKLVALSVLLIASLGLAACGGTDMSGTAGDPAPVAPGEGVEPAPGEGAEQPPVKEAPEKGDTGAPNEPISGGNDVGGDTGGAADAGSGVKGPQTTDVFLANLVESQRVDIDYIVERCNGCEDAEELRDYVQAACGEGAPGCTTEFETLLTKKRTTTQIRNDQGLVGLPTAGDMLRIYRVFRDGVAPADADLRGDGVGDRSEPVKGDDGGEAGVEPPVAGDEGGEEPPVKGDDGGDTSVAPVDVLPAAPAASAKAIFMAMNEVTSESVSWADVAGVADKGDVAPVAAFFEEVSGAETAIPGCDACLDTIKSLLAGEEVPTADLKDLLNAILAIG